MCPLHRQKKRGVEILGKRQTDWKWEALLLHFRRLYETTRVIFGREKGKENN